MAIHAAADGGDGGGADAQPTIQKGEATAFFMANVLQLELHEPGALQGSSSSADAGPAAVKRVLVHYRLPYAAGYPCNDVRRPWNLACLCRQPYMPGHEIRLECKKRRDEATGSTSLARGTVAYVDWLDTDRIIETKVNLTPQSMCLAKESKVRLVSALHTKLPNLHKQLGVEPASTATASKSTATDDKRMSSKAQGKQKQK